MTFSSSISWLGFLVLASFTVFNLNQTHFYALILIIIKFMDTYVMVV